MKRVFTLLAMGLTLFFWLGVLVSLVAPLPGKLNDLLPICGLLIALVHLVQASMVKSACKPYFVVTKLEVILILVFGVFGMVDIRARLKAIIEAKQHGTEINNAE
ncbi:MAG: DUF1145 domain-containing protein [Aeromonas popoffii]|jgi:putative membrane protein|uniref:DUF1145 domain-containing protein n=1 Tax=Aeromonas popoffii TaxID=70856 RepID=A0ABS5GWU3_9GAMM|nr:MULTISPECIES: DUF1145 domain-containing protein [Aeromonas]MBR7631272.1 DUF1145 domain-containing protein [Aeromonas popoffii]MDF2412006.1 DUF1145 domain-containing protein [Aeromonas sp. 1HA1]PTT49409.1 DUF1145 domain-containing protein [Aeromonas sp. HMWF014]